jgi:polyisoprenoid-binding protein YceI
MLFRTAFRYGNLRKREGQEKVPSRPLMKLARRHATYGAGSMSKGMRMLSTRRFVAAAIVGTALLFAGSAVAQVTGDPAAAPAGTYTIDARHTAVLARVPHAGFSFEVFRFGAVEGTLTWNPANAAANSLNVTIAANSIATPVEGFATELQGERFLNSAGHPNATFVSTAFRQIDATHAEVDGNFTLKGVTKPVTFRVELIGAGANQRGTPTIGFRATTMIDNADYNFPGFIRGQSEIVVDGEFNRQQ